MKKRQPVLRRYKAWLTEGALRFSANELSDHPLDQTTDSDYGGDRRSEGSDVELALPLFGLTENFDGPVWLLVGAGRRITAIASSLEDTGWVHVSVDGLNDPHHNLQFCRAGLRRLGIRRGTRVAIVPR